MVSKQNKMLRQQALLRAQRYREEQEQKAKVGAVELSLSSPATANPATDIKINPATGRKMHDDNTIHSRSRRSIYTETSPMVAKKFVQKAFANDEAPQPAPNPSTPRRDPDTARTAAVRSRHAGTHLSSAVCNKSAAHEPQVFQPVPSTLMVDSWGNPISPIASGTRGAVQNKPVKVPFFTAFAASDSSSFTFGSLPLPSTDDNASSVPSLHLPTTDTTTMSERSKAEVICETDSERNIFDVLQERVETAASETTSKRTVVVGSLEVPRGVTMSGPSVLGSINHQAQVSECKPVLTRIGGIEEGSVFQNYALVTCRPMAQVPGEPAVETIVESWPSERMFFVDNHGQARLVDLNQRLYNVDTLIDDGTSDFDSIASPFSWTASSLQLKSPLNYSHEVSKMRSLTEHNEQMSAERMFFADMDGHTRIVDLTQKLYDINVIVDDGGSDFDSVYSPVKSIASPLKLESPLKQHQEVDATSSEDSEDSVDMEALLESFKADCAFMAQDLDEAEGEDTPDTLLSFSGDEDVIDPCFDFSSKQVAVDDVGKGCTIELMLSTSPVVCGPTEGEEALHFYTMEEVGVVQTPDTTIFETIDTSYSSTTGRVITSDAPSSAWTSDLVRTRLGTESLFTFLSHLQADDNGSTTKPAIAATFLKLVSLEREKHNERPLPASYTAGSIIASKIMPHTIFLGTVSLTTFSSHLEDEMTVDEVHRVFSMLSKEDVRLRTVATTGLMGALGKRLGRLAAR